MSSSWTPNDPSTPNSNSRKRHRDNDDTPDSSRRRYNPDHRSSGHHPRGQRRPPHGPPGGDAPDPFLLTVWRLGDSDRFDFRREIPETVHLIEHHFRHWPADVLTAFRVAAVELPHKLPHYALLIALLSTPPVINTTESPIGLQVIRELGRAFQQHIDRRRWRATRLSVQLFGHLNALQRPLVSDRSLLALLHAFVRVLSDDLTCSVARADECVRIVTEGLLRSGLWVRYGPNSPIEEISQDANESKPATEEPTMDADPSKPDPSQHPTGEDSEKPVTEDTTVERDPLKPETDDQTDKEKSLDTDQIPPQDGPHSQPADATAVSEGPIKTAEELAERAKEVAELKNDVAQLVEAIKTHMANRTIDRTLFNSEAARSQYTDPVEDLVAALDEPTISVLPVLDSPFAPLLEMRLKAAGEEAVYPAPVDLPVVLLPPDDDEDGPPVPAPTSTASSGPVSPDAKDRIGYLGVRMFLKMFVDDTVPSRRTADGVLLRTLIHDIIDIFEVNRKECARILLELPRWVGRGTFRTKGTKETEKDAPVWVLEHSVVETIISSIFGMPFSPIRPAVYYSSLVAELCRLSPATVAPALGKCVRRLFAGLGESSGEEGETVILEAEGMRRFADWFAVHLSNFGFLWVWKDWLEVTELAPDHPKRVLVARVLELEIRLSYYDRIHGTVPPSYAESGVMSTQAPGPVFDYEDKEHAHYLAGSDVVQLLKRKEPVSRLAEYLSKMGERLRNEEGLGDKEASEAERQLTVQAVLFVGSRSFSHFLNVLERYLELLKNLTGQREGRLALLEIVSKFWARNGQFELIVVEKLMEYRLVDPLDVVRHFFGPVDHRRGRGMQFWDGLKLALEKVTRRVTMAKKRVSRMKREAEDERDLVRAAGAAETANTNGNGAHPELPEATVTVTNDVEPEKVEESSTTVEEKRTKELESAQVELEREERELVDVVGEAIGAFGKELSSSGTDEEAWRRWWVEGWAREFCRSFGREISDHYEELVGKVEEAKEMLEMLEHTKDWVDQVGRSY